VNVGQTVAITASATDTNLPPPTLTFSLLNAPTNATVGSSSGAFSWQPLVSQENMTNQITLMVTASGSYSLSATQSFMVTVNPLAAPTITPMGWNNGQFTLQISGQFGPDYAVMSSTNLVNWTVLFETNSPTLPILWADTNAVDSARFYRVLTGPPLP
jgi:hypothetical protein